jgi:hypothetical protein
MSLVALATQRVHRALPISAFPPSSSEQIGAKPDVWVGALGCGGVWMMAYRIVGTKEDQTVRSQRESLLIAAAKARVWSREGWDVVVTDSEGKTLDPTDFEKLFAASEAVKKSPEALEQSVSGNISLAE